MKAKLFCVVAVFYCTISKAQSTNLAKKPFKVSHIKLPSNPILDDSRRTYSTNSKFIYLHGFSKVQSGASLDITLDYQGITAGEFEIQKNLIERKDSDGKVTSTYYEYQVVVDYNSRATIQVANTGTAEVTEQNYSENNTLKSRSFSSVEEAKKYYYNNRSNIKKRYRSEQWVRIIRRIRNYLNENYGYIPFENNYETFQILSSKKHPEYGTHQKAYEDLKSIFERMNYKEPIDALLLRAKPIIQSFEEITQKYTATKRKERKLRHASYYNIAKIYYFLDNPDKTRAYALKIIENDFNASEGRSLMNMADRLHERFVVNQLSTRHFDVITEDLTDVNLTPFSEEGDEKEEEKPIEHILAYLITATNDTIATQISKTDISKIGYDVTLQIKDKNGAVRATPFNAGSCKTLALGNGEIYKAIKFGEAANGQSAPKFAKTIHESDKIELFLFNEKELVLKTPDSETGTSTLTPDFIFGLGKKLAVYAKECTNLVERANKNEFKNTQESLLEFCKILSDCK